MVEKEFYRIIKEIVRSEEFLGMKACKHHIKGSVYDHSVKTAYLCYKHHKRFGSKIKLEEFVRGALLHDFYLYDWHDRDPAHRFHGFTHPGCALNNALSRYPDLTETEQDMILHHMFPLTPVPPATKAGWLLCFYDKAAAVSDYFGQNRWKKDSDSRKKDDKNDRINISQTFPNQIQNNRMVKYNHNKKQTKRRYKHGKEEYRTDGTRRTAED